MNKIIVTGGSGLLGKSLRDIRQEYVYLSSNDGDLTDRDVCFSLFDRLAPTKIVHLAARVAGIRQNSMMPYDFLITNCKMNNNVMEYGITNRIPIVFASSSCIYPNYDPHRTYPMTENDVFSGEPEETNNGYAHAKRFAGQMLRAAKKQYDYKYTTLYFCNLFGEHDGFAQGDKAHLVTALIEKFHWAKMDNKAMVEMLGTGLPMRQFMYSYDAAVIMDRIISDDIYGEYNICIPSNTTISNIASVVKRVVGYDGDIAYRGDLDGVYRKDIACDKLISIIGEFRFMDFESALKKTYEHFLSIIQGVK